MMPRILNSLAVLGSLRMELMTEPPWLPVAPNTTRIFFSAMIDKQFLELRTREHTYSYIYQSRRLAGNCFVAAFSTLGLSRSCRDASRSD